MSHGFWSPREYDLWLPRALKTARSNAVEFHSSSALVAIESNMTVEFDVTCEESELDDNSAGVAVKLSSAIAEINVWFTRAEAQHIQQILTLAIDAPGLQMGRAASSKVFWARDAADRFHLLIGPDDTTWDIGFMLPISTIQSMVQCVGTR
jgi:hypothetical protein